MTKYFACRKPGVYKILDDKDQESEFKIFKNQKKAEEWLKESSADDNIINVFTDGACSNNGKWNASAGIGVYFGEDDPRNYSRKLSEKSKHTNNTAEVKAIIQAYKILEDEIRNGKKVRVYSDSQYAIRASGEYGEKQEKNGWKKEIPNKNLVKKVYSLFKGMDNVEFIYVKAHTGKNDWISKGNEGADRLARESSN